MKLKDDMKKVYAVYCRNHDDVIALLEKVGPIINTCSIIFSRIS